MQNSHTPKTVEKASDTRDIIDHITEIEGRVTSLKAMIAAISQIMEGVHFPADTDRGISRAWGSAYQIAWAAEDMAEALANMTTEAVHRAYELRKPSAATGGDNYAALVTLLDERRERVEAHHAAIDAFTPLESGPRDADYEAAEARVRAALEAAYEVETRIIELPARSLRDLRVKLDLVENQGPKKGAWYFDGDQLQALLLSLRGVFGGGHGAQG